jgi:hypothetical protein
MKIRHLFLIAFTTVPLLSARAELAQPQINVSGSADVKVVPDEVYLNVTVETRNEVLDVAKRENDDRISRALIFLKQSGIKEKDIQTDYVSIQPIFNRRDELQTKPTIYQVRKGIGIRLGDVGSFDTVFTGLIDCGVNYVQGIEFRTTELRKYKDQARVLAIHAAKEKADAMAAELGVRVGKPNSVNVNDWSGMSGGRGGPNQNVAMAGGSAEAIESFAVGQISVSATVNVSFFLIE